MKIRKESPANRFGWTETDLKSLYLLLSASGQNDLCVGASVLGVSSKIVSFVKPRSWEPEYGRTVKLTCSTWLPKKIYLECFLLTLNEENERPEESLGRVRASWGGTGPGNLVPTLVSSIWLHSNQHVSEVQDIFCAAAAGRTGASPIGYLEMSIDRLDLGEFEEFAALMEKGKFPEVPILRFEMTLNNGGNFKQNRNLPDPMEEFCFST